MKYEYDYIYEGYFPISEINIMATEGWEVVSAYFAGHLHYILLRREINN